MGKKTKPVVATKRKLVVRDYKGPKSLTGPATADHSYKRFNRADSIKKITVVLTKTVHDAIMSIVGHCDIEVGWWLVGTKNIDEETGEMIIYLTKYYLPEQECHATTTEISETDFGQFDLLEGDEEVLCWGHSHVNMGVTPSGQDWSMITDNVNSGGPDNMLGYTMMIVNKAGKVYLATFDGQYFQCGITLLIEPADFELEYEAKIIALEEELESKLKDIRDDIDVVIKEKLEANVTRMSYSSTYHYGVGGGTRTGAHTPTIPIVPAATPLPAKSVTPRPLTMAEVGEVGKNTVGLCQCGKYTAYVCKANCFVKHLNATA